LQLTNGALPAGTTTDFLPGGKSYSLTAHYSGDGTYAPADSSPVTVTVNPEASKTLVALISYDPNTGAVTNPNTTSLTFGTFNYLLRSDVTNSGGSLCAPTGVAQYDCPTGTVAFKDTLGGTASPIDGGNFSLNTQAYAEDQIIYLGGGKHNIVSSYEGDSSFNSSSSSTDVITIAPAQTEVVIDQVGDPVVGSPLTLTAELRSNFIIPLNAPASFFPTKSVQFFDGGTPMTGTLAYVVSSGNGSPLLMASLTTSSLKYGSHSITAKFAGDANYVTSTSIPFGVEVSIPVTGNLTASANPVQHGSPVTMTMQLTPGENDGPALGGNVYFTANGTQFGSLVNVTNGQAQITTTSLPAGTDTITAVYGGGDPYNGTQASLTVTVNLLASTTGVTTSNAAIQSGASVTLTAAVAATKSGGAAPTGTVQFSASTNPAGPGNAVGSPVALVSGQAALTTTALPGGTQYAFASYSGDANYAPSTASTAEVVTGAASFTMAANPQSVTVTAPGHSGTAIVTLTGQNGYSGTVQLTGASCAGLPSETTCSFSPSSMTLSGSATTATTTVTFLTTAASKVTPIGSKPTGTASNSTRNVLTMAWCALVMMVSLLLAGLTTPRRRGVIFATLLVAAVVTFASCGGGSGGGGGGGTHNAGTPTGSYVITVTASSNVTPAPTATVTLVVQ
jgi:hypothetical protein